MKKKIPFIFLSTVLLFPLSSFGYDPSTHAALTREAYNRSILKPSDEPTLQTRDLLTQLGVSAYGGNLGNIYLDMNQIVTSANPGGTVTARLNNYGAGGATGDVNFTRDKFNGANYALEKEKIPTPAMQSPTGWMMVGSIREDDFKYDSGIRIGENPPQDDPLGSIDRVFNHFHDPYRDIPLRAFGLPIIAGNQGNKAPEWAIEGKDLFEQTWGNELEDRFSMGHRNHFSIKDAKEAMFRAATLRTLRNGRLETLPLPDGYTEAEVNGDGLRRAYWATVFKSLGHAAHLLHDMGQPQHVRNDRHGAKGCVLNHPKMCVGGGDSFYEKYLEARVAGKNTFTLSRRFLADSRRGIINNTDVSPTIMSKPLNYDDEGYKKNPSFNGYYDYYRSQGTGEASYSGKGLANYTNMGFFSAGTNLGQFSSPYPRPPRQSTAFSRKVIAKDKVEGMNGRPIVGNEATLTLLNYPVTDNLTGMVAPDVPLSSYSVFDEFLRNRLGTVIDDQGNKVEITAYSLNHNNYDAQADLLLPRAVSYSAGLIDYFFRGNMEISLPKEGIYGLVDHAKFAPPNEPTNALTDFKGFGKIKLKLKNMTEDIVETASENRHPQTMSNGILVAVLKFYRNKDYTDDMEGELLVGSSHDDYLAKRTNKEEMVVSESVILNRLARDEETELTFNFPQELPINALAPVRLSVVFRGKLGDEEDAVIVSEKPLASPIFFQVHNNLDYVGLANNMCYTREQIMGDDSLWAVLTSNCKKSLDPLAPREFTESCKNESMNAAIDFGGAGSNLSARWLAPEGAIQAPRFGRVAFLVGKEKSSISVFGAGYEGNFSSRVFDYENRTDYYFTTAFHRGVKSYDLLGTVFGGGGLPVGGNMCTKGYLPGHPTLLQGNERYPVPTTSIEGW